MAHGLTLFEWSEVASPAGPLSLNDYIKEGEKYIMQDGKFAKSLIKSVIIKQEKQLLTPDEIMIYSAYLDSLPYEKKLSKLVKGV